MVSLGSYCSSLGCSGRSPRLRRRGWTIAGITSRAASRPIATRGVRSGAATPRAICFEAPSDCIALGSRAR
eukprot:5212920-Pyramimonas_sp.AAC.1